jgi:hypothetical protein
MSVMHSGSKCFWSRLFRAEVVSFAIIATSVVRVLCVALGLCVVILLAALLTHLGFRLTAWMTQPVVG